MWKNILQPGRPQMTTWGMLFACWIRKAIITHSEYVIHAAFRLQNWLQERASALRFMYIASLFIWTNSVAAFRHKLGQDSRISKLKLFNVFCLLSQNCEQRLLYALRMSLRLFICPSVRPSVRMKQLDYYWMDFHEILYLSIFPKSVEKFKVL